MSEEKNIESCEFPAHSNDMEIVRKILSEYKTIAIVGISAKEDRDSYRVASYLKNHGYTIIPVNPAAEEILGLKCYKSLADIPFDVEVVDVFRKPSALPALANEITAKKPKAVWFQIGVINNEATEKVAAAGMEVVQNLCMKVEHKHLFG